MKPGKWNSRKLGLAIAIEALATGLLWVDKIPSNVWETVTMATVVSFCASQAAVDRSKYQNGNRTYEEDGDGVRRG